MKLELTIDDNKLGKEGEEYFGDLWEWEDLSLKVNDLYIFY